MGHQITTNKPTDNDGDQIDGITIYKDGTASTIIVGLRKVSDSMYRVNVVQDSSLIYSSNHTSYKEAVDTYNKVKTKYLKTK